MIDNNKYKSHYIFLASSLELQPHYDYFSPTLFEWVLCAHGFNGDDFCIALFSLSNLLLPFLSQTSAQAGKDWD